MMGYLKSYKVPIFVTHTLLHSLYWLEAMLSAAQYSLVAMYGCLAVLTVMVAYIQDAE